MKVEVDKATCIGCGLCAGVLPEVYCMGADGKAEVCAQPNTEQETLASEAAESCPVDAIHVE